MTESVTNERKIQRWEEDCALTHAAKVHDDGVIELHHTTGTYQMQVSDFNDLIGSQTEERLAGGHKEPRMVAIPKSMLRKVS